MKKILAILVALLAPLPASAQQVRQSGNVTPGHVTKWITTGVIGDGGPDPAGANPTSLNATASGFGICQFSGLFSGSYNRLCFNVTGTGGGFALDNFGGATGGFTWTLNGVTQGLPITTGLPVTINDFACFSDTTGDLKDCGNTNGVNSGTINQLAWYAASGAVVSGLATANNGALVTSAGGVPSISSTLPAAVQGNITTVGTVTTGVWNGTAITGSNIASATVTGGNIATNTIARANDTQAIANTMVGNWTGSTANLVDNTMPSCADSGGNHLNYVNGTGVTCGTGFPAAGPLTNSLGGDVAMNNTANYFDGPSATQGSTGTWWASGTVTLIDTAGSATMNCKLWDGTTVISSAQAASASVNFPIVVSLAGFLAAPAGNLRISCRDQSSTSGLIKFNLSGNSKDSTLSVHRIL
jgi:hypothetical protein